MGWRGVTVAVAESVAAAIVQGVGKEILGCEQCCLGVGV